MISKLSQQRHRLQPADGGGKASGLPMRRESLLADLEFVQREQVFLIFKQGTGNMLSPDYR